MKYLATYYWQAGNHSSSLMLQQVCYKRKRMPILLACVCSQTTNDGRAEALVKALTDWFYQIGLPTCSKRGEKGMRIIVAALKKCIIGNLRKKVSGFEKLQIGGVLCVGNTLCFFQQGRLRIAVLNRKNQHSYSRELLLEAKCNEEMIFREATIQSGVGILLTTDNFYASICPERVEECLSMKELETQMQLEKRLQELGKLGETNGGTDMGAVLIMMK